MATCRKIFTNLGHIIPLYMNMIACLVCLCLALGELNLYLQVPFPIAYAYPNGAGGSGVSTVNGHPNVVQNWGLNLNNQDSQPCPFSKIGSKNSNQQQQQQVGLNLKLNLNSLELDSDDQQKQKKYNYLSAEDEDDEDEEEDYEEEDQHQDGSDDVDDLQQGQQQNKRSLSISGYQTRFLFEFEGKNIPQNCNVNVNGGDKQLYTLKNNKLICCKDKWKLKNCQKRKKKFWCQSATQTNSIVDGEKNVWINNPPSAKILRKIKGTRKKCLATCGLCFELLDLGQPQQDQDLVQQQSQSPSSSPSASPTAQPSAKPTAQLTNSPTASPTAQPSAKPSGQPSVSPSVQPRNSPSASPSSFPSFSPSAKPSTQPSKSPTAKPTNSPSASPTNKPTNSPSASPNLAQPLTPPTPPSPPAPLQPGEKPTVTYRHSGLDIFGRPLKEWQTKLANPVDIVHACTVNEDTQQPNNYLGNHLTDAQISCLKHNPVMSKVVFWDSIVDQMVVKDKDSKVCSMHGRFCQQGIPEYQRIFQEDPATGEIPASGDKEQAEACWDAVNSCRGWMLHLQKMMFKQQADVNKNVEPGSAEEDVQECNNFARKSLRGFFHDYMTYGVEGSILDEHSLKMNFGLCRWAQYINVLSDETGCDPGSIEAMWGALWYQACGHNLWQVDGSVKPFITINRPYSCGGRSFTEADAPQAIPNKGRMNESLGMAQELSVVDFQTKQRKVEFDDMPLATNGIAMEEFWYSVNGHFSGRNNGEVEYSADATAAAHAIGRVTCPEKVNEDGKMKLKVDPLVKKGLTGQLDQNGEVDVKAGFFHKYRGQLEQDKDTIKQNSGWFGTATKVNRFFQQSQQKITDTQCLLWVNSSYVKGQGPEHKYRWHYNHTNGLRIDTEKNPDAVAGANLQKWAYLNETETNLNPDGSFCQLPTQFLGRILVRGWGRVPRWVQIVENSHSKPAEWSPHQNKCRQGIKLFIPWELRLGGKGDTAWGSDQKFTYVNGFTNLTEPRLRKLKVGNFHNTRYVEESNQFHESEAVLGDEFVAVPSSPALQRFEAIAWDEVDSIDSAWDSCEFGENSCQIPIMENRLCSGGSGTDGDGPRLRDFDWN